MFDPAGEVVKKVQDAASQVIMDAIGQTAAVLVPAIQQAAQNTLSGITVTIGPIKIEPITITVGTKEGDK